MTERIVERRAEATRDTKETQITVVMDLDGAGTAHIDTPVPFFNHMLDAFTRHSLLDMRVEAEGDVDVDDHHTVEDIGICLGDAFAQALGDLRGVTRYGSITLPMDEALILTAVDLSGRAYLGWQVELPTEKVGTFDTELGKEFWLAFVRSCPSAVHLKQLAGENSHHILEAVFKGMGRALRQAVAIEPGKENEIPSTKGLLV